VTIVRAPTSDPVPHQDQFGAAASSHTKIRPTTENGYTLGKYGARSSPPITTSGRTRVPLRRTRCGRSTGGARDGVADTAVQSGTYAEPTSPAVRFPASSASMASGVTGSTAPTTMPSTVSGSLTAMRPSPSEVKAAAGSSSARADGIRSKTR
jgi:hypothetical protein